MASTVEFLPEAARELRRLDRQVAARLLRFLDQRVRRAANPRAVGEPLRGERLGACWKYRVGDYRLICCTQDQRIVVTVVRSDHRSGVYRD